MSFIILKDPELAIVRTLMLYERPSSGVLGEGKPKSVVAGPCHHVPFPGVLWMGEKEPTARCVVCCEASARHG
eukprot:gene24466-biopygen10051